MTKIERKNSTKIQCIICIVYFMFTNYSEPDSLVRGLLLVYIESIYQCENLQITKHIEP